MLMGPMKDLYLHAVAITTRMITNTKAHLYQVGEIKKADLEVSVTVGEVLTLSFGFSVSFN